MSTTGFRPFITNNFSTTIEVAIDPDSTELQLVRGMPEPWFTEIQGHSPFSSLTYSWGIPLTLSSANTVEIVMITGVIDENSRRYQVVRGVEGTTAAAHLAGTKAEIRWTAGTAAALANMDEHTHSGAIMIGANAYSAQAEGGGCIVIGHNAFNNTPWPESHSDLNIVIGNYAESVGNECVLIGEVAKAGSVPTEKFAYRSVGIGVTANVGDGEGQIAVGANSIVDGADFATAIGANSYVSARGGIAVGAYARAWRVGSITLGHATTQVDGGLRITAVPFLPKSTTPHSAMSGEVPAIAFAAASQVVLVTDAINLCSAISETTLTLPTNTVLLIDSLDLVITATTSPAGTPQIVVGTDAGNQATLLAATPITVNALHARQTFAPLHANGVTSVRVAVTAAATGGTLTAKLVVRGYVMEV